MRTYQEFNEAISAARLAQLAAKGKGAAAAAKMKADKLSSERTTTATKPKPALPGSSTSGGSLAGGALAKRSSFNKPKSGALATTSKGKSGALATRGPVKPASGRKVSDEKQAGDRPYTYNRGVETLPDKEKDKKKKRKNKCPFGQTFILGKCRGIDKRDRGSDIGSATGDTGGLQDKKADI